MKYLDYLVNIRMFKIALLKTAYKVLDEYLNVSTKSLPSVDLAKWC